MTEHPILFSGEMVNAILQGNKTQTRRVIKPQPQSGGVSSKGTNGRWWWHDIRARVLGDHTIDPTTIMPNFHKCPYGIPGDVPTAFGVMEPPEDGYYHVRWDNRSVETRVYLSKYRGEPSPNDLPSQSIADDWCWSEDETGDPESICLDARDPNKITWRKNSGDVLWVRETWATQPHLDCIPPRELQAQTEALGDHCHIYYVADQELGLANVEKYRPSIHLPKAFCRLRLRVEDVRVERVQDISEEDARAEGVDAISMADKPRQATWSRRQDFAQLWDPINAKRGYGWEKNPWTWVVTFSRIEIVVTKGERHETGRD